MIKYGSSLSNSKFWNGHVQCILVSSFEIISVIFSSKASLVQSCVSAKKFILASYFWHLDRASVTSQKQSVAATIFSIFLLVRNVTRHILRYSIIPIYKNSFIIYFPVATTFRTARICLFFYFSMIIYLSAPLMYPTIFATCAGCVFCQSPRVVILNNSSILYVFSYYVLVLCHVSTYIYVLWRCIRHDTNEPSIMFTQLCFSLSRTQCAWLQIWRVFAVVIDSYPTFLFTVTTSRNGEVTVPNYRLDWVPPSFLNYRKLGIYYLQGLLEVFSVFSVNYGLSEGSILSKHHG